MSSSASRTGNYIEELFHCNITSVENTPDIMDVLPPNRKGLPGPRKCRKFAPFLHHRSRHAQTNKARIILRALSKISKINSAFGLIRHIDAMFMGRRSQFVERTSLNLANSLFRHT